MGRRKLIPGETDLATLYPEAAAQWHPTKNGKLQPEDVLPGTERLIWWLCEKGHEWQYTGFRKIQRPGCPVCSGRRVVAGVNDLATTNPELAAQWHPTKNGDLTPAQVGSGGGTHVWWRCKNGHEWQAVVGHRSNGTGCPFCANQKVLAGFNDLATTNPELAAQWHPTKNGDLTPSRVMAGSSKRIWWMCSEGHEWLVSGGSRLSGSGCPVCSGNTVLAGFNDLATTNPELAAQWHPTKNGDLAPSRVMAGTGKPIWWVCSSGHEWKIAGRGSSGAGCPYCSGRVAEFGVNDLLTTNPELAAQWHPTKNGDLTPKNVKSHTNKNVWWLCEKGHEWKSVVASRSEGTGCPICSGSKVLTGFNDMATTHPKLAAEWHPTKNGQLTPEQVVAGSGKTFWWKCHLGHEWSTSGATALKRIGCPFCGGNRAWPGFNDLATLNPELAAQWHPTRNSDLMPRDVTRASSRRAWWVCDEGHEWVSIISHRSKGSGCPVCAGKQVVIGFNDLATLNPELAAQWHPTKNGDLTAQQVGSGSNSRAWWICSEGHTWSAVVSSRVAGNGCSACAKYGYDPSKPAVLYFIANRALAARKIGITNVGTSRLKAFGKAGWHEVLVMEHPDGAEVRKVEAALFEWIRGELSLPQYLGVQDMKQTRGETETFSQEGPSDHEIVERIRTEFSRLQMQG